MTNFVVEIQKLTKKYGSVVAVDHLSLQIPTGSVFGLLGPNGSGKTTTMGMLLGLVKPTSGSIRLFGQDLSGVKREYLRRIGAIVDVPSFYDHLSGQANLRFFQGLIGYRKINEVVSLLELVGLSEQAHRKVRTYSRGMKQRLGIAYALLGDPELVLLDEPTSGLDASGINGVRDLILKLGSDGRTTVLSSHLLHEVEQICDHVGILAQGRLIVQGRVKDLLRKNGAIRLRTTDDERARRILAFLDWVGGVNTVDGFIVVQAPQERSGHLTQALADQGVYVTEMASLHVSLEELFLNMTKPRGTLGDNGDPL